MNAFKNFPSATALMLGLGLLFAQGQSTLAQTPEDNRPSAFSDSTLVSAIAPYRDDVRHSILLASQQPQVLTRIAQQQGSSQDAFINLIQSFGQTKQGWFYDIARFPDVMHTLATLPANTSQSSVQAATKALPADLQETAWKLYRHHHADLVQVDNLNQQAGQAFDSLIAPLDLPTQAAFRQLIGMPDVMSLLTQQIDKTAQLGQAFQADPAGVTQNLNTLHDNVAAQNQQEMAEYQRELDQDPQARQELQRAGQDYARANGYNTGINPNPAWPNNTYDYQNPYSFWFGYPGWYGAPLWYPSAWGYGAGFAYGLGGNFMLYGLPSIGFSNWFFNGGYYAYPHLYNRFNTYYGRTIGQHRYWNPGNSDFMSAAHRAFNPAYTVSGGRANGFSGARPYVRTNSGIRMASPLSRYPNANAGAGRMQSWGGASYGGMRSFGGAGGFHGGGGFRGGRR
jgi:hypothetical protein